jgi:hypothetical protein
LELAVLMETDLLHHKDEQFRPFFRLLFKEIFFGFEINAEFLFAFI